MINKPQPQGKRYPAGLRREVQLTHPIVRQIYAATMAERGAPEFADIARERASLEATIETCREQLAELDAHQDELTTTHWLEAAAKLIERDGITPKQAIAKLYEGTGVIPRQERAATATAIT